MKPLTVICGLFTPDKAVIPKRSLKASFSPEWANRLFRGAKRSFQQDFRFVCLTDFPRKGFEKEIETIPFLRPNGSWVCLNEVFRPDIGLERGFFLGLDSLFAGPCDAIANTPITKNSVGMVSYRNRTLAGNAVTVWTRSEKTDAVWNEYESDPDCLRKQRAFLMTANKRLVPSEMIFWASKFGPPYDFLDVAHPGKIISFKDTKTKGKEAAAIFEGASVIYFSGRPKPNAIPDNPIVKKYWL